MNFRKAFLYDSLGTLSDHDPAFTGSYSGKKQIKPLFKDGLRQLRELQGKLYAQGKHGLVIILQAMDAGGKDGIIKHVISGVNPQGCRIRSFSAPSDQELMHDFMWRCVKELPARGNIGIFNRSYYEEVLIVRVHPQLLNHQNLPFLEKDQPPQEDFWEQRYHDIAHFEKYLSVNGFHVVKFFLNVSKEEQKKRFLSRIEKPSKNWKFALSDIEERQHWDDYMEAYQKMLSQTSHTFAPWYVIPADKKWFARTAVCHILVDHLDQLQLEYPRVGKEHQQLLEKGRRMLDQE
ncbi:MAG: polyphosphate kinase 2 family protein [Bacteroidales bacterium]